MFVAVGANHAELEPKLYWETVLPLTSMPSSIQKLLPDAYVDEAAGTSVNVGKGGVNVNTGKGTVVSVGHGGVGVSSGNSGRGGTTVDVGKGGVDVHTGKGTTVNVGRGGVGVGVGVAGDKPNPHGTSVDVGKGGVGVNTGKGTSVNVGKGGVDVHTGKGTTVNVGHGGVGVGVAGDKPNPQGTSVDVGKGGVGVHTGPKGKPANVHVNPVGTPFDYIYAASDTQLLDPSAALFFLPNDLRPGKQFTLQLAAAGATASPFISRREADAIPFSASKLSSILPQFSIPAGSAEAATMKATLQECEAAPAKGETKRCVTSLEGMVDFATTTLGTRDVVAVSTEGGGASAAKRRAYKIKAVRRVAAPGGKGVVSCHPEAYAYAVFFCHATTTSGVYEVDLSAVDGGGSPAKAVAVCHTNTAGWNPKHLAFRVLGVKPGAVAVCHFLPEDHVVWAGKP